MIDATILGYLVENKELQAKYDQMHSQGASAWFSDGQEERETILKMGEPWNKLDVLEIGCGEGKLSFDIATRLPRVINGIDYSNVAIKAANEKADQWFDLIKNEEYECENGYFIDAPFTIPSFSCLNYHILNNFNNRAGYNRIVMQGVLEHLDHPFAELKWMIDNLLIPGGDVITSSPCFLNPRGIVWMTLNMLGAVMSKTDLHYLHPWDFSGFCMESGYSLVNMNYCDWDWGNGEKMIDDLKKRIPLALKDGNIPYTSSKVDDLLNWLQRRKGCYFLGATAVYRIQT